MGLGVEGGKGGVWGGLPQSCPVPSAVGRCFLRLNSHLWAELVSRCFRRVFSTSTTSCEIKGGQRRGEAQTQASVLGNDEARMQEQDSWATSSVLEDVCTPGQENGLDSTWGRGRVVVGPQRERQPRVGFPGSSTQKEPLRFLKPSPLKPGAPPYSSSLRASGSWQRRLKRGTESGQEPAAAQWQSQGGHPHDSGCFEGSERA